MEINRLLAEAIKTSPIVWKLRLAVKTKIFKYLNYFTARANKLYDKKDLNFKRASSDEFVEIFKGKKVAIVGNGPISKGFAEEIDSCDVVIRLNYGGLPDTLDENTGSRTDVWGIGALDILTQPRISTHAQSGKVKSIFFPKPLEVALGKGVKSLKKPPYLSMAKYFLDEGHYTELTRRLSRGQERHYFPSTGFATIDFILNQTQCSSLDLYGFSFSPDNRILGIQDIVDHDFPQEGVIVREWHQQDKLVIH